MGRSKEYVAFLDTCVPAGMPACGTLLRLAVRMTLPDKPDREAKPSTARRSL